MAARLTQWLRDPLFLLCVIAGLLGCVVQSGELGTSDTQHRLQTTHWLWTSEPQVFADAYPEFGIHGRDGHLYSWYGIGQSLLMLPADIVGTGIAHWPFFSRYKQDAVRGLVVSYTTNVLINVLTALIAFRFLRQLRFSVKESVAGVLALMLATTRLHYTQNMMENSYIMLLTLTGFSYQYDWLQTNNSRALFVGSCALGLNLLTRLTTSLDLVAVMVFLLLTLCLERSTSKGQPALDPWRRSVDYIKVTAPVYAFFLLLDRAYQFYRFGSFFTTYVSLAARELRQIDPTLPADYPWTTPFLTGFLGPLFQPEKSIFLFDPLLLGSIFLLALLWKGLSSEVRAYSVTSLLLLLAYISFYARYAFWAGDFAWGDRYVSTAVELAVILFVPFLIKYRERFGKVVWGTGIALIVVSVAVQLASLAFWMPLEIYQMETFGHPTFVIALRFKNIVAFALGKMDAWGLITPSMIQDPWDYVHITTWNVLPFVLRRVGAATALVVNVILAIWLALVGVLAVALLRLRTCIARISSPDYQ